MQKCLLSSDGYLGVRSLVGHLLDGLKVFGEAIWPGYYHLFLKNGPIERPRKPVVTGDICEAWKRAVPGRAAMSQRRGELDVAYFWGKQPWLDVDESSDDRPTFEYYFWRMTTGRWKSPRVSLENVDLDSMRAPMPVVLEAGC